MCFVCRDLIRKSGDIVINDYTNGTFADSEWYPRTYRTARGLVLTETANFTQIGPAVSLTGTLKYKFDDIRHHLKLTCPTPTINPATSRTWARNPNRGCWFGGYDYGLIGTLPVIHETDSSGHIIEYTGHFPIANEIFSTINDKGFICSIEIIGQPGRDEEAGQIWLRAWYYGDIHVDIDGAAERIVANINKSTDHSTSDDYSYCPLDGIVYIARDQDIESETFPIDSTFDAISSALMRGDLDPWEEAPNNLISSYEIIDALTKSSRTVIVIIFISFLMMGCGCGIAIKLISCCIPSVNRNGYSKVNIVQYSTDSDTV